MYNFVSSFVKENVSRSQWVEKDVSNEYTTDVRENYREVVLKLETTFHDDFLYVNIKDIPKELYFGVLEKTVLDFLSDIGNVTLETTDFEMQTEYGEVKYLDGFSYDFDVQLGDRNKHYTNPSNVLDGSDLTVKKDGVDTKDIFDNCLFTVNGLLHRSSYNGEVVNILDGGHTCKKSNMNLMGVLYFGDVGKVKQVPITKQSISNGIKGESLKERVYLRINETEVDLNNKSILLSVAGFLLIPDERFLKRCSDNIFELDYKNQPWIKRLFKLRENTCTTCIDKVLSRNSRNPTITSVDDFYSDEVIETMLTLNNSFFIIVDAPELKVEKIYPEFINLPGKYVFHKKPTLPLMSGIGVLSEYHFKKEYDRYVISTNDKLLNNYQYETTDWRDMKLVDDSKIPNNPFNYSKGFFLKIYKGKQ